MGVSNSLADIKGNTNMQTQQMNSIGILSAEREAKQMEIAMITAKRFPRDYTQVETDIERNCNRERLALLARYSFQRGGATITGASVKLLEVVSQCFGNIESGINEIQRFKGYSECEAFAWDFERNVKASRRFTVPHFRDTKGGKKAITEDRDIREIVLNYGSRNKRSCLEGVIPRDLIEFALDKCDATLNSDGKSIGDRITKCKEAFKTYEIDAIQLEKIIGEKLDNWKITELQRALQIFTALRDGETTKKDLLAEAVVTIGKKEIAELQMLIGADEAKKKRLLDYGYELSEINLIPASDYEELKRAIKEDAKKQTSKTKAPETYVSDTSQTAEPAPIITISDSAEVQDDFFGGK